jgi:Right handed beta helix region
VFIANRNYVRIVGFDIRDNLKVSDGSGIRITESADHIELRNNRIHNITGFNAMGITVYGTEPTRGISNLVIDGNEVYRCQPALSEVVSVNGNVHDFAVTNNYVHDNNNIGIDFIGGEGRCPDPAVDMARDGVCSGNRVTKNRFRGTARMAAGIFVDGGQNITVERNTAWRNDVGIGVGCVHAGHVATNITVRDNFVYGNTRAGLSLGGADTTEGRVQNCRLANNTLYHNGKASLLGSEILVRWGTDNVIENNVASGNRGAALLDAQAGSVNNASNYNLFFSPDGPNKSRFTWSGQAYTGMGTFRAATAQEVGSIFADPTLISPRSGNLRVKAGSLVLDAGNPAYTASGELDIDGRPRPLGARVDIGAEELG